RHVDGHTVFREISLLGQICRHGVRGRGTAALAQPFIASEEKELVTENFSSGSGPELVPAKRRLLAPRVINTIKQIPGIQHVVAEKIIGCAVEGVCSRSCGCVNLSSPTTKLCSV